MNMLAAADALLIPVQCEYYALEGLSQLLNTVHLVQRGVQALQGLGQGGRRDGRTERVDVGLDLQLDGDERLAGAVVQFARDAALLLLSDRVGLRGESRRLRHFADA